MKKIGKIATITGIAIAAISIISAGTIIYFSRNLPTVEQISNRELTESTKIFDRTGENLLYEIHGEEKRTNISADQIPDIIRRATISIEDNEFYTHSAFDVKGILRAVFIDIKTGKKAQGGSTITQQLAKKSFLTDDKTFTRKIKELILAYRIEKIYSKDEILNLYLNQIPYGNNAYGIEAASLMYFGKSAKDISLSEAAMLAAIPNAPSYYSPWGAHTTELEDRRQYIIERMNELGYIDAQQKDSAINSRPKILPQPKRASFAIAPHFVMYVQDQLNKKYGEDFISTAGLKVTTTLDKELQDIAMKSVKETVQKNTELYQGHNAALVAEDPKTGQILAMVGSKDYFADPEPEGCTPGSNCRFEGNFNVATQGLRQPGSSFKPFSYMEAFIKGFTPDTILFDVPTEFNVNCPSVPDYNSASNECYHPQNYDRLFRGPITMKESLAQSINITAVQTLYLAGLDDVISLADRLGITTFKDRNRLGLSLVLGGGEVKMIEMMEAYSTLAADGIHHNQATILKVEDRNGKILEEYKDKEEKVVDPEYPRLINDILSDVALRAPLYSSSLNLTQVPGYQVALKTGTTNNYIDAWTYGYTPNIVIGVWAGNNNRYPLQQKGGSILAAVPLWHDFASQAIKTRTNETFIRPEPMTSAIPMVRGELDRTNVHNILYYLNRLDDQQYPNWEEGVQQWLRTNNITTLSGPTYSYPSGEAPTIPGSGVLTIDLINPKNGDFIDKDQDVIANISDSGPQIKKVELFLNETLIDSKIGELGANLQYSFKLNLNILKSQNKLIIRATNGADTQTEKEVIVYR
ncbi:MAG: PBP1A family penicillin-binding protein [Candidatus Colwellbacteria bacterium]|nr:PBP1A family penicillin-binding protein [Candidatus Colwellbacteria bacterium]